MEDHMHELESPLMQAQSATLKQSAIKGLARRRASGEILTYELDGWVVQEHPGGRIERLAPVGQFRAADFPYPGFAPPSRTDARSNGPAHGE